MLGGCYLGVGRAKGVLLPESTSVARTTEASRNMSFTEKHTGLQATLHGVCPSLLHNQWEKRITTPQTCNESTQ